MRTEQLTELFRTVRDQGPSTVRSLVQAIDGPLNRMLGTSACALEVYRPGAIYLSGRISGIDDNGLAALFGIRPGKIKDWTVIDTDVERRVGPASSISVMKPEGSTSSVGRESRSTSMKRRPRFCLKLSPR